MWPIDKEVWIHIGTGVSLVLVGLVAALVRHFRSRLVAWGTRILCRHEYLGKKEVDQHRNVYTALVELRAVTDSDRAYVIRFHNGHEFLLSDPVWKCTCTHEVVRPGITYESMNTQDILVSRIVELVESTISGDYCSSGMHRGPQCSECHQHPECERTKKHLTVVQVEDMASGYAKFFLQQQNIKTVIMCGLTSKHGPFGIVGIDITGAPVADPAQLEELSRRVCDCAERIQYLFLKKEMWEKAPTVAAVPSS